MIMITRKFQYFFNDIQVLISKKKTFHHKSSNCSGQIICREDNFHCYYTDNPINKITLNYVTTKLKPELKKKLEYFKKHLGKSEYLYNHTNKHYNFQENKTIYFDIKAAYLTFLRNSGQIELSTYEKILSFPKRERLV